MKQLTLYSRSGCHLCEAMEDELSPFIAEGQVQVKRIFIDNDEKLIQQYGQRIPVLLVGDRLLCEYFLDADALKRLLGML